MSEPPTTNALNDGIRTRGSTGAATVVPDEVVVTSKDKIYGLSRPRITDLEPK
jgi:hypothetical protein